MMKRFVATASMLILHLLLVCSAGESVRAGSYYISGTIEVEGRQWNDSVVVFTPGYPAAYTDSLGNYAIGPIANGEYAVRAWSPLCLSTIVDTVLINGDDVTGVDGALFAGDLNSDGVIDLRDAWIILSHYGETPDSGSWDQNTDLNIDDMIDSTDVALLCNHWKERSDFSVSAAPPSVEIVNPADGESFVEGAVIMFMGAGEDFAGIPLPDSMLVWESNRDGIIGTGASVATYALSVNTHVITLRGTDGDGNIGSESITVEVTPEPIPGEYDFFTVPATSGYPMGWEMPYRPNEAPIHTVSLDAFRICKYEVSYALWIAVKTWGEANGYTFVNAGMRGSHESISTDQHPVTMVSWRDCIAWCNAYSEREGLTPVYYNAGQEHTTANVYRDASTGGDIFDSDVAWDVDGFRLPTEAEWEYAARYTGGTNVTPGAYHSGFNLRPIIDDCAWYSGNSELHTHPIGQLQPNSIGANDMSGNVWEWCWDWMDPYYYAYSPVHDPHGPETGENRSLRGSCWVYDSSLCRTTYRVSEPPGLISFNVGFRLCRGMLP